MPRLPEELRTERLRLHKHVLTEAEAQYKVVDAEQRLGFKLEGTLKDNIRINGKLCDTMVWAKVRSQRS